MAKAVRNLIKIILFCGIVFLSLYFVHPKYPLSTEQLNIVFKVTEFFGINDPENLFYPVILVIDLAVAIIVYQLLLSGWKKFLPRRNLPF